MATVEYDDILLNIGSRFQSNALNKAIENLAGMANSLKEIKDNDMKSTAQNIKEFTSSLKSVPASTVNSYKQLAKAMATISAKAGKATRELKAVTEKQKTINLPPKISVAEKEKNNLLPIPGADQMKPAIQMIDLAKQREQEQNKVLEETNKELATQEAYWKNINDLAAREARKSRTSWHHGRVRQNNTVDLDPSYGSSLSSMEDLSEKTEKASASLALYKQRVAEAKRDAEMKEVSKEWDEIGKAIDRDITKTFNLGTTVDNIWASINDAVENVLTAIAGSPVTHEMQVQMELLKLKAQEAAGAVSGIGAGASKAMSPLGKLWNKFKNFVQYRMMRDIWNGFIQGAKEGIKNLEEWDRNIGHTGFAESMDKARDSLLAIKNSLAVVSAPLLEWLIGILSKVAQWAVTAANAISRFFAILGGKSTYRAVHFAEGIASAERDATGAAKNANKEFKKQLMAFDEINNLTAQNDSGSGGGKGSGYSSGSLAQMFSEEDVGEISDTEKKLKAIWDWLGKIVEKTKEWFKETKPIKSALNWAEDWYSSWVDTVTKVKMHWSEFVEGFKTARANGADFFEAVQAGLDNIGKHESPEQLHKKFDKFIKSTDAGFSTLEITSKYKSDLIASNMTNSFNRVEKGSESSFKGVRKAIEDWLITPLGDAEKKEKDNQTGIQAIAEFARKWLLPANINDPLTKPLKESKTWADKVKEALNKLTGTYDITINTTENVTRTITEVAAKVGGAGSGTTYEWKAGGGFVSTGQMFIAREAGPELVGTIGGHTAVANNDQIVAAVSQGVASAVASVMGGGTNVTVTLEGDAKGLFRVVQQESRAYTARTGQLAMA